MKKVPLGVALLGKAPALPLSRALIGAFFIAFALVKIGETDPNLAPDKLIRVQLWLYRIGGYLLIYFVDDPVWLALMFC